MDLIITYSNATSRRKEGKLPDQENKWLKKELRLIQAERVSLPWMCPLT